MTSKLTFLLFGMELFFIHPYELTNKIANNPIIENCVFAIVKISYNHLGETPVEGGICGTAFLFNDSTVITANHVLNKINWTPNPGYKYVQYWLLKRGSKKIIELSKENLTPLGNIETTLIHLVEKINSQLEIMHQKFEIGDAVQNYGHISNMPITNAHWANKLIIDSYDLSQSKSDKVGKILSIRKATIHSADLDIEGKEFIQPSFVANVGMSGGPLILHNRVIGLMSFGLPADSVIKKEVYAISINEILNELNK